MNIGNSLKMRRNELGLTQSEVAEKLYVTRQTISNWENNKSYPNIDCLIELSNLYEMTLDRLLKEDNPMMEKLSKYLRDGQKYNTLFFIF
ncbi:helix-turn-helix transcriptional regulator, partial [Enterococcus faecalis]|uniref:helix-turn-helix transcriptional regulator n=1 Tax=Enterococcus faecalis TaxID=1351 RepID=UPI001F50B073